MSTKTQTEKLNELLKLPGITQKLLAEALGQSTDTISKKLSPKYPYYFLSREEHYIIYKAIEAYLKQIKEFLNSHYKPDSDFEKSEKFQNNPEKKEGVVSGKKNEFAGGTLTAHGAGKNIENAFRPFKTDHVIVDCDESGNPVTI